MTAGSQSIENSGTGAAPGRRGSARDPARPRRQAARRGRRHAEGRRWRHQHGRRPQGHLWRARVARSISSARQPARSRRSRRPLTRSSASRSPRLDIPAKVTGGAAYRAGHAAARHGARARGAAAARTARRSRASTRPAAKALPGVIAVVRDGSFLGVVAEREEQAIKAREALVESAKWKLRARTARSGAASTQHLEVAAEQDLGDRARRRRLVLASARALEATYTKPYQAHASIGPSCALAELRDGADGLDARARRVPAARRAGQGR